jgi:hypothetical protein
MMSDEAAQWMCCECTAHEEVMALATMYRSCVV